MISMKLISKLHSNLTLKKVLYWSVLILTGLYIFCVPSFGESSSFTRYFIYLSMGALGVVSIAYCFIYCDLKLNKLSLLIPLFAIFALVGTVFYSHQFRAWFSLVLLAGSFFIFAYAFKTIKDKYIVVMVITAAFFLFSLYFLVYYRNEILNFRSFTNESFRLGTYFDNQNGVAAYAIIGVAAPLYLVLFYQKKIRYLFILPALTSLFVGITTGSRTFLFALIIVLLVFLYFKFQKHKFIYLIVVIAILALFIVLINLPFMATLRERLLRALGTFFGFGTKVDTSAIERTLWLDYGFSLGLRRLIFGYGVEGFSIVSGVGTYSHSNFAETICNFGLLGFIIFYAPMVIFAIRAFTSKKVDKSFILTFTAYYLLVGFANVIYYKKIYYLILAFMFYLAFIDVDSKKKVSLNIQPRRIMFVCDSMKSGGAEKVISTLSNEMCKEGIRVTILGVADLDEPKSFYPLEEGVKYKTLANGSGKRINPFKRVYMLRKTIEEYEPDVVISFLPNANVYTYLALLWTGIPHIVSERNNPYIDPKGKLLRILKKRAFNGADGAVFQTQDAMNFYNEKVQSKGTIIKNPIILSGERPLSNPSRNSTVLAVGRLTKQKNYFNLLDAFKRFNEKKNNLYDLKIYGGGPLKEELYNHCTKLGIVNKVSFMGNDATWHQKEYNDAMFVLSSDYEGMPNSLAEALALGIPSISTDCPTGGSRELIQDGVNGYLVPVNDSIALSNKMVELSNKSSEYFFLNTSNMVKEYSPKATVTKWLDYITNLSKEVYE